MSTISECTPAHKQVAANGNDEACKTMLDQAEYKCFACCDNTTVFETENDALAECTSP